MTESDPILVAFFDYQCRVCATHSGVGCFVEEVDDEYRSNPDRLWHGWCVECEADRTHVFAADRV